MNLTSVLPCPRRRCCPSSSRESIKNMSLSSYSVLQTRNPFLTGRSLTSGACGVKYGPKPLSRNSATLASRVSKQHQPRASIVLQWGRIGPNPCFSNRPPTITPPMVHRDWSIRDCQHGQHGQHNFCLGSHWPRQRRTNDGSRLHCYCRDGRDLNSLHPSQLRHQPRPPTSSQRIIEKVKSKLPITFSQFKRDDAQ